MHIFQFGQQSGKHINKFNSNFIISRIMQYTGSFHMNCAYLEQNGVIGYHQAPMSQLLLIMNGKGQVKGNDDIFIDIQQGDAVYWEKDEWHETRTTSGLTAIIIESEQLDLSHLQLMSNKA